MGRKANPPTSFFTVRKKMGWGVVVRKPARPKRSPALLVCVLIQKGGMKRRSGRFPFKELNFVKSGPEAPRTGPPGGRAPRPAGRGGGANGQRAQPFPPKSWAGKVGLLAAEGRFIVVGSGPPPAAGGSAGARGRSL